MSLAYRHVDVFAEGPLTGNGLIVVFDADDLPVATMQALTIEFRQFETIFLSAIDAASRSAWGRIFTMQEELDFAGHPVVGAGMALAERSGVAGQWSIMVADRVWPVEVTHGDDGWLATMAQGPATFGPVIPSADLAAILASLSLDAADLTPTWTAQMVSTGLPYVIVPVTAAGLSKARIVGRLLDDQLSVFKAKFVYVLDPAAREGRTWDNLGEVEDAATGSAAGSAAAFLVGSGQAAREADLYHLSRSLCPPSKRDDGPGHGRRRIRWRQRRWYCSRHNRCRRVIAVQSTCTLTRKRPGCPGRSR